MSHNQELTDASNFFISASMKPIHDLGRFLKYKHFQTVFDSDGALQGQYDLPGSSIFKNKAIISYQISGDALRLSMALLMRMIPTSMTISNLKLFGSAQLSFDH